MSIQAVGWVLDHSSSRGLARLVLISLANHANADDVCWPAQRTIAKEAGVASGTVAKMIRLLVTLGEIEMLDPGDQRRSATYRVLRKECSPYERSVHVGVSAESTPGVDRTVMNRQEEDLSAHACEKCSDTGWLIAEKRGDPATRCACNPERAYSRSAQ